MATLGAPTARGAAPPRDRPNLVVIVLDTVRLRSVDPRFGGPVAATPEIGRLAASGTTFDRAIAPGNWTVPSHMSLLTGTYPWVHGRRSFETGPAPLPTIAEWLRDRGYATAVFTEETHLVAGYGLESGYDERFAQRLATSDEERTIVNRLVGHSGVLYSPGILRLMHRLPPLAIPITAVNFQQELAFKREVCGPFMTAAFERWLERRPADGRPFHALFNFVDGHEPYAPGPGIAGWVRLGYSQIPRFYLLAVPGLADRVRWTEVERRYLRAIESADVKVGAVVRALDRAGARSNTWVVVTSDHGQVFGERGYVYHGCGAQDAVARVPLVMAGPSATRVASRIEGWTSLCEVPSFLKSVALGQPPFGPDGSASVPFPAAPPPSRPVFCEGGPASDPNFSLRGLRPDAEWNHRLIAAYDRDTKWTMDLATRTVHRSAAEPDADRAERVTLSGVESVEALARVYGIRSADDFARFKPSRATERRRPLKDERMRSWGYD
ncbi:MAG TPA: sulfatase-like hydrolase/transferase [Thermoplasmata archaeon]|nr:sulfatase-like hydrolase/transferase [Thermoplasmata archaeon]